MVSRICSRCGGNKNFAPSTLIRNKHGGYCRPCKAKWAKNWRRANLEKHNELTRKWQSRSKYKSRMRKKVIEHYGGRCKCCGEDCYLFLAIDHVNNDGAADRKKNGSSHIWKIVIREGFPARFQILCHNCNYGKYRNGGICPHKSGVEH